MRLWADYHTHTTYSHGTGSVRDNTAEASAKGLEAVAITDHGPANPFIGVSPAIFPAMWQDIKAVQLEFPDVRVLAGVETNIHGLNGELDLPERILNKLDVVVASLHPVVKPADLVSAWDLFARNQAAKYVHRLRLRVRVICTKAVTEAVMRHRVTIVGHPGAKMDIDTPELARVCERRGTAMEINNHHADELKGYTKAALPSGVQFSVDSDAHTPANVGRLDAGLALVESLKIPAERIINAKDT